MHDDHDLVEGRIRRELAERISPHLHDAVAPLTIEAWHAPGEPVPYDEAVTADYEPFRAGSRWGNPWGTTWFRCTGDVPTDWDTSRLEAVVDLGFYSEGAGFQAEGLVWLDAAPLQGVHPRRTAVPLRHLTSGPVRFHVEAAANPIVGPGYSPTPMGSLDTAPQVPIYRLRRADLALRNPDVDAFLLDTEILLGLLLTLPRTDTRRTHVLRSLEAALDLVDPDDVAGTVAAGRKALQVPLDAHARASALNVVGVGHAHIDTAWLWPLRETVRKCARTFASATRLMDDDPDYHFVCSQAVQYAWMEERYPALFERITERVAAGRFVPVGGMWVEADMNLPGGESLIRQLVAGQRYFDSRFGVRCREAWIPDVFGYPASLPQVFAAGGCDRFITQKLSWNKQNRFPHSTFQWEGLDGTRVLTHFPPVDTYNAEVVVPEMAFGERNFRDHDWSRWALMPYGYGNGGGGPTREMVERAHRMADLDGVPKVTLGTTDEFFAHVDDEIAGGADVPVWRGELYFEMHRGTLTSQIRTKLGNRRCEALLREAELWWTTGGALPPEVAEELDVLWKEVLVQQFHDILPGSSIAWVHDDAEATFARVADRLEELIGDGLRRLPLPDGPVVANAASRPRTEVVDHDGTAVLVDVPGLGLAPLAPRPATDEVVTTTNSMANDSLAVTWDDDGTITSIVDRRRDRELLPPGRVVTFDLAPDRPVEFDAWDVEAWVRDHAEPLGGPTTVSWVRRDPLVAELKVERAFGRGSTIATTIRLRAHSARLDLHVDVDWHESERLLSLLVPLDVRADDAVCDIQFGHVRRPTHPSSPWDAAKFEVCAHRFVDLAEPDFGVAVLNDGRFGHGLFEGGIRVSLLRAARFPDPDADQGRHEVTIAVLPHGPGLGDVLVEADALNRPLRIVDGRGGGAAPPPPVVTVDHPGVEVDAVKRSDRVAGDPGDDLIVRLHEAMGNRARIVVSSPRPVVGALRCNALEEPVEGVTHPEVVDGLVTLEVRPFEIVTLRLTTDDGVAGGDR